MSLSYQRIPPTIAFDPLQPLYDLDRSSPQFYNQLSDLFREQDYRDFILNLKGDDLARLVGYLDSVSLQGTSVKIYIRCWCRFSPVFLIPQATRSRNFYMNLKIYAAPRGSYRSLACFQTLF